MGRGKEGKGEERGDLQRSSRLDRPTVGHPDVFVVRFSYDLQALGAKAVLDAGCGTGRNSNYLTAQGLELVCLDSAINKVREARDNSPPSGDSFFAVGDLENLPFSSKGFDAVVCTNVLEYLDSVRIRAAIGEFRRILRSGGVLLLVTAAKEGARLEEADDLGGNDYVFRRGDIEVRVHLTDRAELEGWLQGFTIREAALLSLEYPRPATANSTWSVVAKKEN